MFWIATTDDEPTHLMLVTLLARLPVSGVLHGLLRAQLWRDEGARALEAAYDEEPLARAHVFTCACFKFNLADLFQRPERAFVNMRNSQNRFSRPITIACDRRTDHLSIAANTRTYSASRDCFTTERLNAFSNSSLVAIEPRTRRYRGRVQFSPGDTTELKSNASPRRASPIG